MITKAKDYKKAAKYLQHINCDFEQLLTVCDPAAAIELVLDKITGYFGFPVEINDNYLEVRKLPEGNEILEGTAITVKLYN